jgi:hypothetical protein
MILICLNSQTYKNVLNIRTSKHQTCQPYKQKVRLVDKKNWDKNDNYSNQSLANLHRLIQACEQIG